MKCVLIIDDDPVVRSLVAGILRKKNYEAIVASTGDEGLQKLKTQKPDLVITDFQMPGLSGLEVLAKIKEINKSLPVVLLTAHGDPSLTIESMQEGAFDYIEKPINPRELLELVKRGIDASESGVESIAHHSSGLLEKEAINLMAGKSPDMLELFKSVGRLAANDLSVMIVGETGVGKERLAKLIHQSSAFRNEPMVYVDCKSEDGISFADEGVGGADASRFDDGMVSAFTKAGKGTIVLNEIGKLVPGIQNRLLSLINHLLPEVLRQGSGRPRIISLTTEDVGELVRQGKFAEELFYRLNVFSLHIPPLRLRKEDIPVVARDLLQELNPMLGKRVMRIEDAVLQRLQAYDWPGNVRELKNVLMQALVLSPGDVLDKKYLRLPSTEGDAPLKDGGSESRLLPLAEVEKGHIAHVLGQVGWSKQDASAILGITRPTLNAKIEKYGLQKE